MASEDPRMPAPLVAVRARPTWPWPVAATGPVLVGIGVAIGPTDGDNLLFAAILGSIVAVSVVVGAMLTSRVPGNPIGRLILASGVALAGSVVAQSIALSGVAAGAPLELIAVAAIAVNTGLTGSIVVVLIVIPLVFPDGRLLSARWRWVLVLAALALGASFLAQLLGERQVAIGGVSNPFYVPALRPVLDVLDAFASWTSVVGFGAAALAVLIRYRRGDVVERQQLKWLIAVAAVAAVAFPVAYIVPAPAITQVAFLVGLLALLALPVAIAIAVLRYHLYEIDRIISRTIGWAVITGVLGAAFVVLVVGLEALLQGQTQGETLAVAASTLAAFGLFQPVRRRVQAAVDRRFDRARYDAQRTADAFAERLRDEVELDVLAAELQRTVEAAIRPSAAALWLPSRDVSA
jgi:hypothetical protein